MKDRSMNFCRTTFRERTGMLQWLEDRMKWKELGWQRVGANTQRSGQLNEGD